ncbi:hypothetical protein [Helicobacter sp. T3_23-1059]
MRTKWQKQTTLNNPLRKHIFARFSQKWAFWARLAKIANFCTHFANLQFLMFKPYFLQKSIKNLALVAFILGACLLNSIPAKSNTLNWDDLEETQKTLLKKLWNVGKPYDLHYALIAISYAESRLGLYPLNLQTYDCGVLHINIKSYLRFNKIKDSPLNRNIYCGNLIVNEDLSINAALDTLQYFYEYWAKRKKNPLEYAIKSYNAGFKVHSTTAQKYYNKVYKNIQEVKKLEKQGLLRQQRATKTQ